MIHRVERLVEGPLRGAGGEGILRMSPWRTEEATAMADTKTRKTETSRRDTGDEELNGGGEEALTPGQKQWWEDFVGAKSTGFTFSAEEYLRRSPEEE
jgi:hypothetical protein